MKREREKTIVSREKLHISDVHEIVRQIDIGMSIYKIQHIYVRKFADGTQRNNR